MLDFGEDDRADQNLAAGVIGALALFVRRPRAGDPRLELLQAQLRDARDREARLLTMLEAEQQARRELEQKLLPAPPKPSSFKSGRLGVLLALLVLAITAAVFFQPDWMR